MASEAVSRVIAAAAVRTAVEAADVLAPGLGISTRQAEALAKRMVEQDPLLLSFRGWGGFWSLAAAVAFAPEVQAALATWVGGAINPALVPVVLAIFGAGSSWWSKRRDPRPVRGGTPTPFDAH
jgi:hypothetical protein